MVRKCTARNREVSLLEDIKNKKNDSSLYSLSKKQRSAKKGTGNSFENQDGLLEYKYENFDGKVGRSKYYIAFCKIISLNLIDTPIKWEN
jgi:hypothetical protein